MGSSDYRKILEKGGRAERLDDREAMVLIEDLQPDRVQALGRAAYDNRTHRYGDAATYVGNLQINPSNICAMGCTFCNYAADPQAPHAYALTETQILEDIASVKPVEVHIVGGLNRVWPYERNLELVREIRRRDPLIHIKAYTAVEIDYFARTSGKSVLRVLEALRDAGVDALPGGGAEIFSERLHRIHWKHKIGSERWLEIHDIAHGLGIPTNATLLFGFGDTWPERVTHLLRLREAQDRSMRLAGRFECFIPLPFQSRDDGADVPSAIDILVVLALSRLILENIAHIKAYWPMTGLETAAAGLSWGADDMDGTIQKERIAHLAGAVTPVGLAKSRMEETIRIAGFHPRERNGRFAVAPIHSNVSNIP